MSNQLAGKTITVNTHKNMNVDELAELVRTAFSSTQCRPCTSGGHLILREAADLTLLAEAGVHAVIS